MEGGQIKEVVSLTKSVVKTSGDIVNDLAVGLSKSIGGVTNGLEIVADAAGKTLNTLSKNLEITSVDVFSRVGDLGLVAAKDLGDVVKVVPILGRPVAYVVKGAGRGIYYVVTSVGHVLGKSIATVGRVGKDVSDLVVFTIASTSAATEKTIEEAGEVVSKVAHSLNNNKKTKKNRKGTMKKRV
jgi:hypothetical protein